MRRTIQVTHSALVTASVDGDRPLVTLRLELLSTPMAIEVPLKPHEALQVTNLLLEAYGVAKSTG